MSFANGGWGAALVSRQRFCALERHPSRCSQVHMLLQWQWQWQVPLQRSHQLLLPQEPRSACKVMMLEHVLSAKKMAASSPESLPIQRLSKHLALRKEACQPKALQQGRVRQQTLPYPHHLHSVCGRLELQVDLPSEHSASSPQAAGLVQRLCLKSAMSEEAGWVPQRQAYDIDSAGPPGVPPQKELKRRWGRHPALRQVARFDARGFHQRKAHRALDEVARAVASSSSFRHALQTCGREKEHVLCLERRRPRPLMLSSLAESCSSQALLVRSLLVGVKAPFGPDMYLHLLCKWMMQ
mmetsp:Transcript_49565/g.118034  ORF Transcript_49565/g.118034 Transcript_49565/m.118034 type:complete len:297 (+) Transcript_49565:2512-3402(+)